jgi:hypothetical protein
MEVQLYHFKLCTSWRPSFTPRLLYIGETRPNKRFTEGWVGHRASLENTK